MTNPSSVIRAPLLAVVAVSIMGVNACEKREIVTPKHGSTRVFSVDHPVSVRTNDAKGAVAITAQNFETGQRELIYFNPEGDAAFNEVIPEAYWKCAHPGLGQPWTNIARDGCVASLQVSDDRGTFYTSRADNKLYVCTESYYQVADRKHCDQRSIDIGNLLPIGPDGQLIASLEWEDHNFLMKYSHPVPRHDYVRNWDGDHAQLLFSGFHDWTNSNNAWDPSLPHDFSGAWQEYGYSTTALKDQTFVSGDMYSVDIGVCSVFLPWEWKDRDQNSALTPILGQFTGNLGIAEAILEGMKDEPIRESVYEENAKRWMDTLTEVWQRPLSSEFHFRVTSGNDRQMCFVQYAAANNRLKTKPGTWEQAFAAFFFEMFRIGDCPTHNARVHYCGTIEYDRANNLAEFVIDESTAKAWMEPYGLFRPACRKQFVPRFEREFAASAAPIASAMLTENLALLLGSVRASLGDIRRIEVTPKGIYLVTAESEDDPQYGVGQCIRTLEGFQPSSNRRISDWSFPSVPGRGITVEYP